MCRAACMFVFIWALRGRGVRCAVPPGCAAPVSPELCGTNIAADKPSRDPQRPGRLHHEHRRNLCNYPAGAAASLRETGRLSPRGGCSGTLPERRASWPVFSSWRWCPMDPEIAGPISPRCPRIVAKQRALQTRGNPHLRSGTGTSAHILRADTRAMNPRNTPVSPCCRSALRGFSFKCRHGDGLSNGSCSQRK